MVGAAASYPFEGDPLPVAVRMTSSGSAGAQPGRLDLPHGINVSGSTAARISAGERSWHNHVSSWENKVCRAAPDPGGYVHYGPGA
jgi:hypothetical protein